MYLHTLLQTRVLQQTAFLFGCPEASSPVKTCSSVLALPFQGFQLLDKLSLDCFPHIPWDPHPFFENQFKCSFSKPDADVLNAAAMAQLKNNQVLVFRFLEREKARKPRSYASPKLCPLNHLINY